jgi:hypothetical protein
MDTAIVMLRNDLPTQNRLYTILEILDDAKRAA